MKQTIIIIFIFISALNICAQTDTIKQQKNIIKFQFLHLCIGEVKFQYEKVLNDRFSVALGLGFIDNEIGIGHIYPNEERVGFEINPQGRYYFYRKAPVGIYTGLYGVFSEGLFKKDKKELYGNVYKYFLCGGGFIVGNQTKFKHFTIDTYIGGGIYNIKYIPLNLIIIPENTKNIGSIIFLPTINFSLGYSF